MRIHILPTIIASGLVLSPVLASCEREQPVLTYQDRLAEIVTSPDQPDYQVPGAALLVLDEQEPAWAGAAGTARFDGDGITPLADLTPQTPVRAASMSKLVTALTAGGLADQGVLDLDENVLPLLGFDPRGDGAAMSMRQLLAHTSGVCDPDVYWAALGETLADLLAAYSPCDYLPGEGWTYANINYGLAAEVMEITTGERFDQLANRLVLDPAGLSARFNWSGSNPDIKANGGTLYRLDEAGQWLTQTDGPDTLARPDPSILRIDDRPLETYQPGENGTLFSPQGGLRASVVDLAVLAGLFRPDEPGASLGEPVWLGHVDPGVDAWGTGPQILMPGQVAGHPGLTLIGHSGEAYGLYGGTWTFIDCPVSFAFFVNGTNPRADASRDLVTGMTVWEAKLMDMALEIAVPLCAAHKD